MKDDPAVGADLDLQPLPFAVVGIGASAGGLMAFKELLGELPADIGMAFVLIPHLSPNHESLMASILDRSSALPVREVDDEPAILPNHVYVIPPGRSMIVESGHLKLLPRPHGPHRAVDQFFESLARDQHSMAIGVILSGTGSDGSTGIEQIKAEGGLTFAQASAEYAGMPESAGATGCVDFVLPAAEIGRELARLARLPFIRSVPETVDGGADPLRQVLQVVEQVSGDDFSHYKRNTIGRRVARRMVLNHVDTIDDYVTRLGADSDEALALHNDILINVTSFFRDPKSFEALKTTVFPALAPKRERNDPVRVWIVGCATGEEVYSLAIALTEFAEATGTVFPVQIFATDLKDAAIEHARAGVYSPAIADSVAPERLHRFFTKSESGYRVVKSIRNMCVFARHNMLTDPPFSRVDFIACRNVLIYLEPVLQQRLVATLHYALKPDGFLWLGNSETVSAYRNLFEPVDSVHRIYARRANARRHVHRPSLSRGGSTSLGATARNVPASVSAEAPGADAHREADRILLSRYIPASVLVNADYEILQFRGDTDSYLAPPAGKASFNLLKMLRDGLLVPIRRALSRARHSDDAVVREPGLRVRVRGEFRTVNVEVVPIRGSTRHDDSYLVTIEETAAVATPTGREANAAPEGSDAAEVARLTQELAATKEYLQSVIEQQENANAELHSANEEVQSANEELQSINEELETSKEEIQSSNEELATVNDELQHRNSEVQQSNNDLLNLLSSVQLAIVMLDSQSRIRRFTDAAESLLNLIGSDVGRPLSDIRLPIDLPELDSMVHQAITSAEPAAREAQDRSGRWYSIRVRPYRTTADRVDGAVLVLVDVDTLKRAESSIRESEARFRLLADNAPVLIWLDGDDGIQFVNRAFREFLTEESDGRNEHQWSRWVHPDERDAIIATYTRARSAGIAFEQTCRLRRRDGEYRWMKCLAVPRSIEHAARGGLVGSMVDITDLKDAEEDLRRADRNKNEFLAMLAHELRNPLASVQNVTQLLRSGHADGHTSDWALDVVDQQSRALARMVDDLLDVTRITRGHVQLREEVLDVRIVVEQAVEAIRHQVEQAAQQLTVQMPGHTVVVHADRVRLQQAIANLLHNAAKFTPSGGSIAVAVQLATRLAERDARHGVEIRVRDTGIGLDPEIMATVFDPFMQADRAIDRAHGGLGIGLTLVQRLVQLHGGEVTAASEGVGRGAEFVIWLPLTTAPLPHPPVDRLQTPTRTHRIMIVDDNIDAGVALEALLELLGHNVVMLENGTDVADRAREFKPDVVLLDLGLPGKNGYEVGRELRQQPETAHALLVAVTGYGGAADRERTRAAGFDEHYTKPLPFDVLQERLEREPLR